MDRFFIQFPKLSEIPDSCIRSCIEFLECYSDVIVKKGGDPEKCYNMFNQFIHLVAEQCKCPFKFEPYHQSIRSPFDYYAFGIDFISPIVDLMNSTLSGENNLYRIETIINGGGNVVLFSNHQVEPDPQALSILLGDKHSKFAEDMIFMAGSRVTSDPLAVPFSMGRNLLCIHSKRHMDNPPEDKAKKQIANGKTMRRMVELFNRGGAAVFVAPSGGRDRVGNTGCVEVAPFDPQSIALIHLMAKKSTVHKVHFFPMALSTHSLLPPPKDIKSSLGESRITKGGAIHVCFCGEVDIDKIAEYIANQDERRITIANTLWEIVHKSYKELHRE